MNYKKMTNKELFSYCKLVGQNARQWKNKFIATLPEVFRRRLYKKNGYCSIYEFAAKLGGISHNVVDQTLRVSEKIKDLPELQSKIEKHGIHKVRVVSSIANEKTQKFWADNIEKMSKAALEMFVRLERKSDPGIESAKSINTHQQAQINLSEQPPETPYMSSRERFGMDLDPKTILKLRLIKQKFEKEKGEPLCWDDVMKKVAGILLYEKPVREYKQRESNSRTAPAKKRREVFKETNGKCAIEGCNMPAVEIHHEDYWSINRNHENLKPLCRPHHELEHQTGHPVDVKFRKYLMA